MADTIQFVDAVSATANVRLDLNDEVTFWCREFNAPPPRLRRSLASNSMTDGGYVSSSVYEPRTLSLVLDLITAAQDTNAAAWQTLARELDRESNIIKYQPQGASEPVFFRTWRSDIPALEELRAAKAFRRPAVEILAEPFAVGVMEEIVITDVYNDPAAATNGCYFDIPAASIKGDVASPLLIALDSGWGHIPYGGVLARTSRSRSPYPGNGVQAEACNRLAGTVLAAANDPLLSGSGNNYARTTLAATMTECLSWAPTSLVTGTYRLAAHVRRNATTATVKLRAGSSGQEVEVPKTTARQRVDLGLFEVPSQDVAGGLLQAGSVFAALSLYASGTSAETMDWDFIEFAPADEQMLGWLGGFQVGSLIIDSASDIVYGCDTNDPTTATIWGATPAVSGGMPYLEPAADLQRFHLVTWETSGCAKGDVTTAVVVRYFPRYLYVRPSSS